MIYFEEERIFWSQRKVIKTLQASVQWVLQEAPNTAELLCVWMKGLCSLLWIWTFSLLENLSLFQGAEKFQLLLYLAWSPQGSFRGPGLLGGVRLLIPLSSCLWLDELWITHLPHGMHSHSRAIWAEPGCFSTCRSDQLYVEINLPGLA